MKKEIKNKSASIRAKLMNIAMAENIDFDALLLRYFQERLIYRLSISDFSKHFILKGGLFLICLKLPKYRPTKDIDFLAVKLKNDINEIKNIFSNIAKISCNDGVKFIVSSITAERIKEGSDYEGIRIKIDGTLGQAKKKLQIDIGFGDIVIPDAIEMEFPTLIEKAPKIKAYSPESIIAEKFEAMVKLAMVNSRMKDFYDIYFLSLNHNFNGKHLKEAIEMTFHRRKTSLIYNPLIFRSEFSKNIEMQKMWIAFRRKSRLYDVTQNFSEVIQRITNFLKPIVISIVEKREIENSWIADNGLWI